MRAKIAHASRQRAHFLHSYSFLKEQVFSLTYLLRWPIQRIQPSAPWVQACRALVRPLCSRHKPQTTQTVTSCTLRATTASHHSTLIKIHSSTTMQACSTRSWLPKSLDRTKTVTFAIIRVRPSPQSSQTSPCTATCTTLSWSRISKASLQVSLRKMCLKRSRQRISSIWINKESAESTKLNRPYAGRCISHKMLQTHAYHLQLWKSTKLSRCKQVVKWAKWRTSRARHLAKLASIFHRLVGRTGRSEIRHRSKLRRCKLIAWIVKAYLRMSKPHLSTVVTAQWALIRVKRILALKTLKQ